MNPVHYSSAKQDWTTPQDLFDRLNAEFAFCLDAAASGENAKCTEYLTDALEQSWQRPGAVYCNPPYGRGIAKWIAKAAQEAELGATVVCLLPARPDTAAWHTFIWDSAAHRPLPGVEVRFIRGRLKFGDARNAAPFPSAVVVFRPVTHV